MEFMLIYEWINETDGSLYEQRIEWFDTKEELLEEYKQAKKLYQEMIKIGRLYLYGGIHYCWADIENLF